MRYLMTTLAITIGLVGLVAGVNWWVDPYGYFLRSPFGLYEVGLIRSIKSRSVASFAPEGLLLGSSTTEGIDPGVIPGCRIYNAAYSGATALEILHSAQTAPAPLRVALIGLDLTFMNETFGTTFDPDAFTFTWRQAAEIAFSLRTFHKSLWTVKMWKRKRIPAFAPNGFRLWSEEAWRAETPDTPIDHAKALEYYRNSNFSNWHYSAQRLEIYRAAAEALRAKGARVLVYINPMGQSLHDLLDEKGITPDLERFRRDVTAIFPDAVDFSAELTDNALFFRNDPLHYPPPLGERLIKEVLARQHLCGL